MPCEVTDYNRIHSSSQIRDAKELLEVIKSDQLGKQSIIVDVGCRSGVVTNLLAENIAHDNIFAHDCCKKMVDYAETHNQMKNVHYSLEKFDSPWETLSTPMKNLESSVDLVWSNRILHWVKDKPTAVSNIARLLRPGGRCYTNITLMRDFFESLTAEERIVNENVVKFVKHDQQVTNWTNYFHTAGFSDVKVELLVKEWTYDSPKDIQALFACIVPYLRQQLPDTYSEQEKQNIIDRFTEFLPRVTQTKIGEPPLATFDPDNATLHYGQIRIVAIK